MIHAKEVTKHRGTDCVLDRLSLSIETGEQVLLLGPSGGGKSTLLRCLNGLEGFQSGSLHVAGISLPNDETRGIGAARSEAALLELRRKVGLVFQHFGLFAHMTAKQNIMEAPRHVLGMSLADSSALAMSLLEKFGVAHRADALPEALSGGEKQRVALARALAMKPSLLLLDEPTSALDEKARKRVCEALLEVAEGGTTLVFASHDMEFARAMATRAILIRGGAIAGEGTLAEML